MAIASMARASDPNWQGSLVETLMGVPDADGVSATTLAQAWRNARERVGFLRRVEVRDAAGCTDAVTLRSWISERRVVAVGHRDLTLLPIFQFDAAGEPLPAVAEVLAALGRDDWSAALWFDGRTEYLDDARPIDVLASDPERVVSAARREARAAQI